MLHAFDAESLEELWAFVPPPVLDKLRLIHNTKGSDGVKGKSNSIYLVDGTPTIKDIYYQDKWRTVLMAGLGYGVRVFMLSILLILTIHHTYFHFYTTVPRG